MQQCIKIFIIPYQYEAQHVSGDTAHHQEPKLHWQPPVFHTWTVVRRVVGGRCHAQAPDDGQCVARNMLSFI